MALKHIFIHFLVCKGLSDDDIRVARATVFQAIRPGAGVETGDVVREKVEGGYRRKTLSGFEWRLMIAQSAGGSAGPGEGRMPVLKMGERVPPGASRTSPR